MSDYQMKISKATAIRLTDGLPPRMGYEKRVKSVTIKVPVRGGRRDVLFDSVCDLFVVNKSGLYFLESYNTPTTEWRELFGINPDAKTFRALIEENNNI